jgi:hypothetical protein
VRLGGKGDTKGKSKRYRIRYNEKIQDKKYRIMYIANEKQKMSVRKQKRRFFYGEYSKVFRLTVFFFIFGVFL